MTVEGGSNCGAYDVDDLIVDEVSLDCSNAVSLALSSSLSAFISSLKLFIIAYIASIVTDISAV